MVSRSFPKDRRKPGKGNRRAKGVKKMHWDLVILSIWVIGNFYSNILVTSWKSERFVTDGEEKISFERECVSEGWKNKGEGVARWYM